MYLNLLSELLAKLPEDWEKAAEGAWWSGVWHLVPKMRLCYILVPTFCAKYFLSIMLREAKLSKLVIAQVFALPSEVCVEHPYLLCLLSRWSVVFKKQLEACFPLISEPHSTYFH